MAESRSASTGAPSDKPLREPRDSRDVEVAFAQLRDLVDASGRPKQELAEALGVKPQLLTKLLRPGKYGGSGRDWPQIRKILVAVSADVEQYAHAHGHLWGLDHPTPDEPDAPDELTVPEELGRPVIEAGTQAIAAGARRRSRESWGGESWGEGWLGDDAPTMPLTSPPAPRDGSPTLTRRVDVPAPRVPPLPLSVPPPVPPKMPTWVPAPSTFRSRGSRARGRGRLSGPRWGVVAVLAVVLVTVAVTAVVAVLRGVGSSEPESGAVSAQQAPATSPTLPEELPGPLSAAPTAPKAPPELLSRPDVVNTVAVGPIAGFAALSSDGRTTYVAHRDRGVISEIDTATDLVRASYPVPAGPPQSLVVSPDGSRLYVSVYGRTAPTGPSAVAVLDARTRQQTSAIPLATRPFVPALTPDGRALWVPDHDTGTISVVDLTTNTIAREFPVSPNPHWIAFSDDGARAYAANHESNVIDVIDTATYRRLTSIPVGTSPHSIALQPRGSLLAVAAYDTDGVDLVDTTTATRVATVPVGRNPNVVRWSPDGRLLYATVETEGRVAVIDPAARRVVGEAPVGQTPSSIALTPDGTRAYVTNLDDGTVSVLRITR